MDAAQLQESSVRDVVQYFLDYDWTLGAAMIFAGLDPDMSVRELRRRLDWPD